MKSTECLVIEDIHKRLGTADQGSFKVAATRGEDPGEGRRPRVAAVFPDLGLADQRLAAHAGMDAQRVRRRPWQRS